MSQVKNKGKIPTRATYPNTHWDVDQILPNLYLGDVNSTNNESNLRAHGITGILRVMGSKDLRFDCFKNIAYHEIDIHDSPTADIKSACIESHKFIESICSKGGKVLVHCRAGASRSATVVISYLMKHKQISFKDALDEVRSKDL